MSWFSGQRVLVTGGAAGIGLCAARAFAAEGAALILVDRDGEALARVVEELRSGGAQVEGHTVDVSSREQVAVMAADVLAAGPLDVLVNNAGVGHTAALADTPLETWKKLLEVNLWGVLHHVDAFLPAMRARGRGRIVNVSSGQAFFQLPTWGAYAAIKACVGIYSEILSYEVARDGVKVTTVYPFMVNTGFYKGIEGESAGARLSMKLLPLYSQKPETVGRILVRAAHRGKRVEMVHVINDLGRVVRFTRPVGGLVSRLTQRVLAA